MVKETNENNRIKDELFLLSELVTKNKRCAYPLKDRNKIDKLKKANKRINDYYREHFGYLINTEIPSSVIDEDILRLQEDIKELEDDLYYVQD